MEKWKEILGINKPVKTFRIRKSQVTNEYNRPYRFVGVCLEGSGFTIYHDRKLTEEDIVHELCHVSFPELTENSVRKLTKILLDIVYKTDVQ
jgi:hypothetical protein